MYETWSPGMPIPIVAAPAGFSPTLISTAALMNANTSEGSVTNGTPMGTPTLGLLSSPPSSTGGANTSMMSPHQMQQATFSSPGAAQAAAAYWAYAWPYGYVQLGTASPNVASVNGYTVVNSSMGLLDEHTQ